MSRCATIRTQTDGTSEARARVTSAEIFLEVAAFIEGEDEGTFRTVGASLAVLAHSLTQDG